MHFLEHYYATIIKYNLIHRFNYKNSKEIPKLKRIILPMFDNLQIRIRLKGLLQENLDFLFLKINIK